MSSPLPHNFMRQALTGTLSLSLALSVGLSSASPLIAQAAETNQNMFTVTAVNLSGSRIVNLTLQGTNIYQYLVAETPDFLYTDWALFTPNAPSIPAANGDLVEVMHLPYTLSEGDGEKTIYVKYRSVTEQQSEVMTVMVTLSEANSCLVEDEQPIVITGCEGLPLPPISGADRERYRLGVSPKTGEYVPSSFIFSGDYVRAENTTTVYCVTSEMTLRPFMDETSYFTQTLAFLPVKWVRDETLSVFTKGLPMLPRQDVALLKFQTSENVYYFVQDPEDPNHGILHWITTPELATYIAGENWADYVIDLNPTLASSFDIGSPYITMDDVLAANIDLTQFRSRELLNEDSSDTVDPGVTSSLFEQTQQAIRAAGEYLRDGFEILKASLRKRSSP